NPRRTRPRRPSPDGYLLVLLGLGNTEYLLLPACQSRCQALPVAAGFRLVAKNHSGEVRHPSLQDRHSLRTLETVVSLLAPHARKLGLRLREARESFQLELT